MSHWIDAGAADDLADGAMKALDVEGNRILLARDGDLYFAANERCPHMGGPLSRGILEGTVVTCPRHGSRFDLSSGEVVRWTDWSGVKLALAKVVRPPRPVKTYPVRVEEGRLRVDLG
jgi:3-phenylpropionate/trans-cinnamate dioxygenase ferredoxin subunit